MELPAGAQLPSPGCGLVPPALACPPVLSFYLPSPPLLCPAALHLASRHARLACIKVLLEAGAGQLRDRQGRVPLDLARCGAWEPSRRCGKRRQGGLGGGLLACQDRAQRLALPTACGPGRRGTATCWPWCSSTRRCGRSWSGRSGSGDPSRRAAAAARAAVGRRETKGLPLDQGAPGPSLLCTPDLVFPMPPIHLQSSVHEGVRHVGGSGARLLRAGRWAAPPVPSRQPRVAQQPPPPAPIAQIYAVPRHNQRTRRPGGRKLANRGTLAGQARAAAPTLPLL